MTSRKRRFPAALATICATLAAIAPALSATITVTTTSDGPVGGAGDDCTLRAAIASANEDAPHADCVAGSSGLDEIRFDGALAGASIVLTEGQLAIDDDLTITGPDPGNPTGITIDAGGATRVLAMIDDGTDPFDVELASLTLTGGNTTGSGQSGGAIDADHADLTLDHVIVTDNSTADSGQNGHGGGVAVRDGALSIFDSEISNNSVADVGGGGVSLILGELLIERSRITGNSIADGQFQEGSGIDIFRSDAVIRDSLIANNTIQGDDAGGAGITTQFGDHELSLVRSTVSGNSINGNDAMGAGLFIEQARLSVINSTISGNTITGTGATGGAVWVGGNEDELARASFLHATLLGNTAELADGIHYEPGQTHSVSLDNSLVTQTAAGETACNQPIDGANSLATDISCTGTATDLSDLDPGPLQDTGGLTPTHSLGRSSLAIDAAGDCLADHGIDTDQRGFPRPGTNNPACDSGAWEFQDLVFRDRFEP